MTSGVRLRMLEGAGRLLARRGLNGTSFSEVLKLTGAPRGSVYHHFPGGKDELVAGAVDLAGQHVVDDLEAVRGAPPVEVVAYFLDFWRGLMRQQEVFTGCAIAAVSTATESDELLDHAAAAFRAWRHRLGELLAEGGLTPTDAERFAATLLAATEGAVILTRAERDLAPFELVAEQLMSQVRALTPPAAAAATATG